MDPEEKARLAEEEQQKLDPDDIEGQAEVNKRLDEARHQQIEEQQARAEEEARERDRLNDERAEAA